MYVWLHLSPKPFWVLSPEAFSYAIGWLNVVDFDGRRVCQVALLHFSGNFRRAYGDIILREPMMNQMRNVVSEGIGLTARWGLIILRRVALPHMTWHSKAFLPLFFFTTPYENMPRPGVPPTGAHWWLCIIYVTHQPRRRETSRG